VLLLFNGKLPVLAFCGKRVRKRFKRIVDHLVGDYIIQSVATVHRFLLIFTAFLFFSSDTPESVCAPAQQAL
jgi:hypothetical protein